MTPKGDYKHFVQPSSATQPAVAPVTPVVPVTGYSNFIIGCSSCSFTISCGFAPQSVVAQQSPYKFPEEHQYFMNVSALADGSTLCHGTLYFICLDN